MPDCGPASCGLALECISDWSCKTLLCTIVKCAVYKRFYCLQVQ